VHGEFEGVALRLGRPSFCDAERRAAAILDTDPAGLAIAFGSGTESYILAVRRSLRGDAIELIAKLGKRGLRSRFRLATVAPPSHAARTLSIERWRSAITPGDKIGHVSYQFSL
jgi:Cu2+-exporting ATPase